MHKIVKMTLGAAVAATGTFTVSYPDGTNKADFLKGVDHRMFALQKEMFAPKDFTISFGDSVATITYNGVTTIPISSDVVVQLDMVGSNAILNTDVDYVGIKRALPHKVVRVPLGNPDLGDLDLLVDGATSTEMPDTETVTYTAATSGTAPLDNASIPDVVTTPGESCWDLSFARNIQAKQTAGGGTTIATSVTVKGYDEYLKPMTETLTMAATATSVTTQGKKAFRYVRSIAITAAADAEADTLEVGTGDILGLPIFVGSQSEVIAEYENDVRLPSANNVVQLPFLFDATKYAAGTSIFSPPSPVAGAVKKVTTIAQVQTNGAGAVTAEIGGVAVDGIAITVASGTTVGTADSATATAGHASTALDAGESVEITSDGTPTAGELVGFVEVVPTSHLQGTLVTGSRAKPTAATGDLRGTYTPQGTLDGSKAFAVDVLVDNPSYIGGDNYSA